MGADDIDASRLLGRLAELGRVGADPAGGITRLALTDADQTARRLFKGWLQEAGLEVLVDDGGTIWGRTRAGSDPPLLLGSHLDSVRNGGRFDGALGVVAALEVVQVLAGRVNRRLGVVSFTGEEGARFRPALLGSSLSVGARSPEEVYALQDDERRTFGAELRRIGDLGRAEHRPNRALAYLELHIEQGPVLEAAGRPIGVVEGIVGMHWYDVEVRGEAGHAGSTPWSARRDALVAAAAMVGEVRRLAQAEDGLLATVGRLQVEPNVHNVIPGRVSFSVDLRAQRDEALQRAGSLLAARLRAVAEEHGCRCEVLDVWDSPSVRFHPRVREAIVAAARELGVEALPLWSGPSHDARMMATVAPAGMVFVPSRGGVSHHPAEETAPAHCVLGARVLLGAARRQVEAC